MDLKVSLGKASVWIELRKMETATRMRVAVKNE